MVESTLIAQQLINGLLFGGLLALIAVGLTLIWGVMRILNFAHGAMFMIGGYVGLFAYEATGTVIASLVAAAVALFVLGIATERTVVATLRNRDDADVAAIIGTFGLAVVLENIVRITIGSKHRSLPTIDPAILEVGPIILIRERVILFAIAIVSLGLLFALIQYTKLGLGMRAVAQDDETAQLMGVRADRIYAFTFGLGAALAGLAGVLLAPIYNIFPSVGWEPFLFAFIVVIIGGLGSVRGTLVAALTIGLVRSLSLIWLPNQETQILLFVAMIAVLFARPGGIAGVVTE